MGQEHTHLVAVVHLVVLLDEVVDVALGAVVGEVASVAHTGWASRVFVVARVVALVGGTHCRRRVLEK